MIENVDKNIYLVSPYGLGDTMILCGLKDAIEDLYKGNVVYHIKKSHECVMQIYGIKDYVIKTYTKEELYEIGRRQLFPELGKVFVAHPEYLTKQECLTKFLGLEISFVDMYKQMLNLPVFAEYHYPSNVDSVILKKLEISNIEKIALVAPELNATAPQDQIPDAFYVNKIAELEESGYTVIVNATKEKYRKLFKGYVMDLTMQELFTLAVKCSIVVSSRSGLCDLIFREAQRIEIVYPNQTFWEMYNVKKTYGCVIPQVKEIVL